LKKTSKNEVIIMGRSKYSTDEIYEIFIHGAEMCHLCGRRLELGAYGVNDHPRGWEVEHGNPLSRGGTETLRNLRPACIKCNRSKGSKTTAEYRKTRDDEGYYSSSLRIDDLKFRLDRIKHRKKTSKFIQGPCVRCEKMLEMPNCGLSGSAGWDLYEDERKNTYLICNRCARKLGAR
jgi:hypothetical protein